jgi:hypothetical protein
MRISRVVWSNTFEVFDTHVTDFESVASFASKWLCNKKFLHFNLVSSAILWELWINRNNIVFNKVIWIIIKIGVGALIHAGMGSVAQRSKGGKAGSSWT